MIIKTGLETIDGGPVVMSGARGHQTPGQVGEHGEDAEAYNCQFCVLAVCDSCSASLEILVKQSSRRSDTVFRSTGLVPVSTLPDHRR